MNIDKNKFTRYWGDFIGGMEWNVFMTLHYYNGCSVNSNRGIMNSIFSKNKGNVIKLFYISEYNSDFKNVHSHSLILLNNLGDFKKRLSKMRSICNIDLVNESELCKTEEGIINVGYYVTKFIDRDLDFDLYI
jgi:hypothetical protein